MKYYAKSNPPETLEEHTQKVLDEVDILQKYFENNLTSSQWDMLKCSAFYHDIGKLDSNFQQVITAAKDGIKKDINYYPHNFLSCALIDRKDLESKFGRENCKLIIRAISFHHSRTIPNDFNNNLKEYVEENVLPNASQYNFMGYSLPPKISYKYCNDMIIGTGEYFGNDYIKIKGMLNRADYSASAGIDIEEDPLLNEKSLGEYTAESIERKGFTLRALQQYMLDNSDSNLVVTAATGSGKTEGSLLWIGNSKAFYTLPLKISINAIFDRIINETNIGYSKARLLHSDALSYYISNSDRYDEESPMMKYSKSKMFSSPLTLCTIDQILRFAYKFNGAEMYLSTLSCSKLVIDEIQTYSPELMGTIIYSLKLITELGGKFAIVTATFPKLLMKLFEKAEISCKYSPQFYGDVDHRHRIALLDGDDFDLEQIVADAQNKKVLIIVNKVSHAQNLYSLLSERCSCHLLHSMFLKKDRDNLEKEILAFAPNDHGREGNGLWISTQIVEASLDIDFDVMYTEMCTIDSLLQRMGRVYRSREYDGDTPNVYILDNRSGVLPNNQFIDSQIYELSLEAVKQQLNGESSVLLSENASCDMKTQMIDYVYADENKLADYYKRIKNRYTYLEKLSWYSLQKADAVKYFREIDSITLCPHEIYEKLEADMTVQNWKSALKERISPEERQKIKDEIAGYTVSISFYHGLDYGKEELFYRGSQIYMYNGSYDFDEQNLSGNGLIRQYKQNNRYIDEGFIF